MNSTNNNSFEIAAKKVFSVLYALIKEDENKPKQINVLDSSTFILIDAKPKPVNLLDLSTDILNTIGDFVKKDDKEREEKERKDNIKRERDQSEKRGNNCPIEKSRCAKSTT
jgi:hypothetical protein